MKLHRLAWAAGMIGLPLAHYWLLARVEPFYTYIYCFLWWSYIFVTDFAVCRLNRRSLLRDNPREFLVLTLWSAPVWMIFEMVNLRLRNWYYVMTPANSLVSLPFLVLAFATVLPGIFETTELALALIEKVAPHGIRGRPFAVNGWNVSIQIAVGAAMLALPLIFPGSCFCLAWGFAFFLTDPICYWARRREKNHVGRSLLGQLAAGDNTRLVALLVAGFICGGLWEAWNIGARTKWIYSVPFFDELKLGEMPLLGFGGFPPFALECYALVNFLGLFRDGRNWELSAAENRARRGMPRWGVAACAVVLPVALLTAALAVAWGRTILSYSVPLDRVFYTELGPRGAAALRERHALQGDEFLKLTERPPEIALNLYARMRRVTALSELKGMGLGNALALEKLGVTNAAHLARCDPSDLYVALKRQGRYVRQEEIAVWVREALRRTGD